MQLMSYIPIPPRENEKPFLMPVEDVFSITGVVLLLQVVSKQVLLIQVTNLN